MKAMNKVKKTINLKSFVEIMHTGNEELKKSFVNLGNVDYSNKLSKRFENELPELENFACQMMNNEKITFEKLNGYILNYVVNVGIREQFDVLRFSSDLSVNIELKRELPDGGFDAVKNQLIRHKYLLELTGKSSVVCTFISVTNKIYLLNASNKLEEISLCELIEKIPLSYSLSNELDKTDLSQLILSPYSQSDKFLKHQYFLTDAQLSIRNKILRDKNDRFFAIVGGPGTGKSLVMIDLAKKYQKKGKKVVLLFCSALSESDELSENLKVRILPIKRFSELVLDDYDVVLVDEAQRLYKTQYEDVVALKKLIVIFSVDHQQVLHAAERELAVEERVKKDTKIIVSDLKEKVRTDEHMNSFIKKFIDLRSKGVQPFDYEKVNVIYFDDKTDARDYISKMCSAENFVSIELTEYRTKTTGRLKRKHVFEGSKSVHSVIGKEYDKVIVPIDEYFKYDEHGKLSSNYADYYPYFQSRSIFEALTRVKNNLLLVVVNNPKMYCKIQEILTWKNDKLAQ